MLRVAHNAIAHWKKHELALPGPETARSRTGKNRDSPYPDPKQRDRAPEKTGTRLTRTRNSAIVYWRKQGLAYPDRKQRDRVLNTKNIGSVTEALSTARSRTTPDKI